MIGVSSSSASMRRALMTAVHSAPLGGNDYARVEPLRLARRRVFDRSTTSTTRRFLSTTPLVDTVVVMNNTSPDNSPTNLLDAASTILAQQPVAAPPPDPSLSELGFYPTDFLIRLLTMIHDTTGLPWWAAIVGTTVMLRTALFPLTIISQIQSKKIQDAKPELEVLTSAIRANPPRTPEEQMANSAKLAAVYKKHDIRLHLVFLPIFAQIPVWISFFFALRRMAETFPSFKTGGLYWFTDLAAADPTYALPLLTAGTMLVSVELGGENPSPEMREQTARMKMIMRFVAVGMVPMTLGFPSAVFTYWTTSNTFTVAQALALKSNTFRTAIGLHPVRTVPPPFAASKPIPKTFASFPSVPVAGVVVPEVVASPKENDANNAATTTAVEEREKTSSPSPTNESDNEAEKQSELPSASTEELTNSMRERRQKRRKQRHT